MLTYNLNQFQNQPLYMQLYSNIKKDILSGTLKCGEKLPSKRSLAEHLKISVITVESAYAQLISEGYIYTQQKKGYFCCAVQTVPRAAKNLPFTVDTNVQGSDKYFANFCDNSIMGQSFPFSVWSKQMREVLAEQRSDLLQKTPYNGLLDLRRAIADFLYSFRGMPVNPEQIIIGAGTEYLYTLLLRLLCGCFALEDPGYKTIAKIYTAGGVQCKFIPMDKDGINIQCLRQSGAAVVHVSPSHHFPTGIVMPINRRQQLLSWAYEKEQRYIIEDDYDSEFRFSGKPIPTMQSIDKNGEKVIYINTFSKTISPSIRISYMVLPPALCRKYKQMLSFYSCTVSGFEQLALAKFIEKGYFERHINRMRNVYRAQRNLVIEQIKNSSLANKVTVLEENAGLHFIMQVNTALSDEQLVLAAKQNGVKISCLSQYCQNPQKAQKHMIILNYSGIDQNHIEPAIKRLAAALE